MRRRLFGVRYTVCIYSRAPAMAKGEAANTQIVMVGLRHRTCSARTSVLSKVADE